MKIVMVDFFLPNSIYSLELCDKLSAEHEVVLICKDNYKPDRQFNFTILPILHSSSKNPAQAFALYIKDLKKIYRQVKETKADILHLQGVQHFYWETRLLKAVKKTGCKVFFTAHNILSHETRKGEKKALNKWYHNFDGIIVHNKMSKKMLLEASDYRGKIYVIAHGAYGTYKNCLRRKTNNTDKTVFLQFGIIRDYKGVDILLQAVSMLPEEYRKKALFVIAGSLQKRYYDFDIQAKVKELGIEECVELKISRIDDDKVPELFNNSDCCVFPYRHIYGSGALLMAYTFNKPVIVSSVPVFCEETNNGETGIIFEKNDPDKLSEAIVKYIVMDESEKILYQKAIQKAVEKKYNWTVSAQETLKAYKNY